jgi:hypothetical protein
MKRLIVLLLIAVPLLAQEAKKSEPDSMLQYYIDAAKPVEEHKRLAELTGPWNVTTRFWFGGDVKTSSGKGEGRAILGGRFVILDTTTKGSFDAEAMSIFGFDRRTSEYTMVGYDTLGTYYVTAAGKPDAAQKGVVLRGSYKQPPANNEQAYRFVWTRPSDKEHLLTLYFTMDGKDVRVAETQLTRP